MTIPRTLIWMLVVACAGPIEAQVQPNILPPASGKGEPVLAPALSRTKESSDVDRQRGSLRRASDDIQLRREPTTAAQERAVQLAEPLADTAESLKNSENTIRLTIGQGRILTTKSPVVAEGGVAVIAIGDPTIADFQVLPNPRMLRLTGKRPGITDLTLVTSDEKTLIYELHVQYDLSLIQARIRQSYPGAAVTISQLGEHLVLEGQARDPRQIVLIEKTVRALLESLRAPGATQSATSGPSGEGAGTDGLNGVPNKTAPMVNPTLRALPEVASLATGSTSNTPQIINLIGMPGVQQVLLQVRVAELDRTGLREIGADSFFEWGPGNILGTKISSAQLTLPDSIAASQNSLSKLKPGANSTGFGIFPTGRVEFVLRALHQNSLLRVLAEPNLVALSGHEASFLAGGEFPVPVPQGNVGTIPTVQFKEFGVQLSFVPHILDDDVIRLEVRPEVSTIEPLLGTTLVVGGSNVPGIISRRVHTTVEMREGESLALAGLLLVSLDASTARIPLLGDLPVLGPLFSNTTHKRQEKELLVIVTPYLVSPIQAQDVPPLPGEEIAVPDDLEFFLLNRIEGKRRSIRAEMVGEDPLRIPRLIKLQKLQVAGPVGFAPPPSQNEPEESLPPPMSSRRTERNSSP